MKKQKNFLNSYKKSGKYSQPCNASRIDAKDPDRMEGQESIAIAIDALAAGNIEQTIEALQIADSVIERIRRRL